MQLTINGHRCNFIPLKKFRTKYHLPDEFGVALFEPKNRPNLGSIDGAGPQLAAIRVQVLEAIPATLSASQLMPAVENIVMAFHVAMRRENAKIKLHPPEIDFAVAGFHDVLQAVAYRLVQLQYAGISFDFDSVYQNWLDDSVRVSTAEYRYPHNGEDYLVRLVNNIYGRVGLIVTVVGQTCYVEDTSQACPATGFMDDLCRDVSDKLCALLANKQT